MSFGAGRLSVPCLLVQDATPVQDKGPPKSITVEDSFKDCSSLVAAEHVIKVLAPDLLARMVEDQQVTPPAPFLTVQPMCTHVLNGAMLDEV